MRTAKFKTLFMAGMFLCLAAAGWAQEKTETKQERPDSQQAGSVQSSTPVIGPQESGSKEAASPGHQTTQHPKEGHIEHGSESGHEVFRFFDKGGVKRREIRLGQKTLKAKLDRNTPYNAATFGLKISSDVARWLEAARKKSDADMEVERRFSKYAEATPDGKFVVLQDRRDDFLKFADGRVTELYGEAVERESQTTVYDEDGNEILQLTDSEGWHPRVSNTGRYFVVTIGDSKGLRILNRDKAALAEVPFVGPVYFSDTDRFILLVEWVPSGKASISVYDTVNKKLELGKILVARSTFQSINTVTIIEGNRTLIIKHAGDVKTRQIKTDKVQF